MAESTLNQIIDTSLQKIKELAHTETVIGDPISLPNGVTILPISKISMGFVSGGLDFNGKKAEAGAPAATKFGGGGGTGVSITPVGFLTVSATGTVQLLPITDPKDADALDKITALLEKSPDILKKLKDVISSKREGKEDAGE